ncbi:MAG: hypothetical protein A2100_03700 [Sideroxydans sp. GWF2_59_14]|nr:MAG: hypothetical protein A2100_03700 [Sideroxydans sp. GWF2_59_14]HAF45836.1 hypothetical protein [Gallionellaceae bacterium]
MEILFSLAGRVHVLMRREINRIIDVEWMCADAAYAKEVIKLARTVDSDELQKLADRVEQVHPKFLRAEHVVDHLPATEESKYMTTLR